MNKKNNIILVGMPGAGKTYYGNKLGEKLDKPLGKSGVNHRLARINEIAEKIRSND